MEFLSLDSVEQMVKPEKLSLDSVEKIQAKETLSLEAVETISKKTFLQGLTEGGEPLLRAGKAIVEGVSEPFSNRAWGLSQEDRLKIRETLGPHISPLLEGILHPTITGVQTVLRGGEALVKGVSRGVGQIAEESGVADVLQPERKGSSPGKRLAADLENLLGIGLATSATMPPRTIPRAPRVPEKTAETLKEPGATVEVPKTPVPKEPIAPRTIEVLPETVVEAKRPSTEPPLVLDLDPNRPNATPPFRVYHGTSGKLESFDMTRARDGLYGPGAYFTENPEIASQYAKSSRGTFETSRNIEQLREYFKPGRVLPNQDTVIQFREFGDGRWEVTVKNPNDIRPRTHETNPYLADVDAVLGNKAGPNVAIASIDVKNPFRIDQKIEPTAIGSIINSMSKSNAYSSQQITQFKTIFGNGGTGKDVYRVLARMTENDKAFVNNILKSSGYDGITHIGGAVTGGKSHRVWIAFDNNQIQLGGKAFGPATKAPVETVPVARPTPPPERVIAETKSGVAKSDPILVDDMHIVSDITASRVPAKHPYEALKEPTEFGANFATKIWERQAQNILDVIHNKVTYRFSELGRLPQQEAYLGLRYRTLGVLDRVDDFVGALAKRLKATADVLDRRAVYEYLTTRGAAPTIIKNNAARNIAVGIKDTIDKIGQTMVQRGMLSPDSYAQWQGQYLPRVYLAHMYDVNLPKATGGGKGANLAYLKERKDIPEHVRKVILGEIEDPIYLSARALVNPLRDMAKLDMFRSIAGNPEWVAPNSIINIRGRNVTAAWAKAEAARLDEMAGQIERSGLSTVDPARVRAEATSMRTAAEQAGARHDPRLYSQLPDTPRYGEMRGAWVRKEIVSDIVGTLEIVNDTTAYGKMMDAAVKGVKTWKLFKVGLNPPSQFRNIMSNVVLLDISGVGLPKVPIRLAEAAMDIARNGQYWNVAKDYGIKNTTFASQELMRFGQELLEATKEKSSAWTAMQKAGAMIADMGGKTYAASESLFKTAKIIDEMKRGATPEKAALEAHKWLYDYSLAPPFVKKVRDMPFGIPFLTFQYKTMPRLAEVAIKHPWRFAPYAAMGYGVYEWFKDNYNVTDKDVDAFMKSLSGFLKDKSLAYPLPFKDEHGRWQVVDLGYIMPWGQIAEALNKAGRGQVLESLREFAASPGIDFAAAIMTNIDPFTKREIVRKGSTPMERVEGWLNYVWRMAMPTWMTDVGAGAHTIRTMQSKVNPRTGEPLLTDEQAAMRWFGLNIYPQRPEETRMQNLRQLDREIQDARTNMTAKLRDKNLTPEARSSIRNDHTAYIRELIEKKKKYATETVLPPQLRSK